MNSVPTIHSVKLYFLYNCVLFSIFVLGDFAQNNRYITLLTPVRGFRLQGHVFSNHSVELKLDSLDQCALARECVSCNTGPMINNKMACELSTSDHLQHPEDLNQRKGWFYRGTEETSPCIVKWSCLIKCPKIVIIDN